MTDNDKNSILGDPIKGWGLTNGKSKLSTPDGVMVGSIGSLDTTLVQHIPLDNSGEPLIDTAEIEALYNNVTMMTEDEYRHKKILDEMADTFSKKNSDYGNAFEEVLDDLGASYAVGRLKEKHKRLTKLVTSNKQEVDDESIEDTLLDMANYAVLTIMWLQKQKENK